MYIKKITEGSGIPNNAVLDGYSTSQTDAYSCNFINNMFSIQTENINCGIFQAYGEKFNQTYDVTIPSGYTCLGIVGWYLTGGGYTVLFVNKIDFDNVNSQIGWSIRNSYNGATADITLTVKLLLIKNTDS